MSLLSSSLLDTSRSLGIDESMGVVSDTKISQARRAVQRWRRSDLFETVEPECAVEGQRSTDASATAVNERLESNGERRTPQTYQRRVAHIPRGIGETALMRVVFATAELSPVASVGWVSRSIS